MGNLVYAAPANVLTAADIDAADITVLQKIAYQHDPKWGGVARKSLHRVSGAAQTLEREDVYSYDKTYGDLVKVDTTERLAGGGVRARAVSYEYDPVTGWLVGVNAPEGRIVYRRDPRGRLVRLQTSTGIDTTYEYDSMGRLAGVKDPALATDPDNALASDEARLGRVAYAYDPWVQSSSSFFRRIPSYILCKVWPGPTRLS